MKQAADDLWTEGLAIVRKLVEHGHEAYLVGGCVRDRMLGRELNDIDITTSAAPHEVIHLFSRTVPTGLKHGTVTVIEKDKSYEVTTFRQENGYSDARRPDEVLFVKDVYEDLARRDFTINAMAVGLDGELVDPFGGEVDLEEGRINAVGEAAERFQEDALRMLRAIRFTAEFDFKLTPELWQGIIDQRSRLVHIAMERVSKEWDKMMAGSGPELACHYLFKSGLLMHTKVELPIKFREAIESYRLNHLPWEWSHVFPDLGSLGSHLLNLPLIRESDLRFASLYSGFGISEQLSFELCRILKFSNRRISRISGVVGFNDIMTATDRPPKELMIHAILTYGRSVAEDWLVMAEGEGRAVEEEMDALAGLCATSLAELNIRGDELSLTLDRAPGPWMTDCLEQLLEEVAYGRIPNERAALLERSRILMGKWK